MARATALAQGLQALGWIDGRNAHVDYRWAAGKASLFPQYAAELVALAPDVILTSGGAGVPAVLQVTRMSFQLQPGTDRPHVPRSQGRLRPGELVPCWSTRPRDW
jgi:hypothetical protein